MRAIASSITASREAIFRRLQDVYTEDPETASVTDTPASSPESHAAIGLSPEEGNPEHAPTERTQKARKSRKSSEEPNAVAPKGAKKRKGTAKPRAQKPAEGNSKTESELRGVKFQNGDTVRLASDEKQTLGTVLGYDGDSVRVQFKGKKRPTVHNPLGLILVERPKRGTAAGHSPGQGEASSGAVQSSSASDQPANGTVAQKTSNRPTILGFSVCSACEWMGVAGFTVEQAQVVMTHYGVSDYLKPDKVKACLKYGIRRGRGAAFSPEQATELQALVA